MFSKSVFLVFLLCTLSLVHGSNNKLIEERKAYIVYMGDLPKTTMSLSLLANTHHNLLSDAIGNEEIARQSKIYSYGKSFNGFAARLLPHEAKILSEKENVVSVFPNKMLRIQTTKSWESIGMPLNVKRNRGVESDIIVGVLDIGIYIPSPSFNDSGFGPPPKKWKGKCVDTRCNNKVIGSQYFALMNSTGWERTGTPDDFDGHGTHTSSTAAGIAVEGANYKGYMKGTARGGVPSARIASYKVCWLDVILGGLCSDMDILAGIDAALHDGVDILSISIGGKSTSYFEDSISIGGFHAMKKGVLLVSAAGNEGPNISTLCNVSPWLFTVAASSDRNFKTIVMLGDRRKFIGTSVSPFTMKHMHPLLDGPRVANTSLPKGICNASTCDLGCLNAKKVKDKIIFCRGSYSEFEVEYSGGVGIIMTDNDLDFAPVTHIPATIVSNQDGDQIHKYINTVKNAKAWIQKSRAMYIDSTKITITSFSSRGPSDLSHYILKPDISAPGHSILGANTQLSLIKGEKLPYYQFMSGTSQATPHVSGAAAYVKSFHPNWSPSAIKSALMTTAKPFKIQITGAELATGSGQLNPRRAVKPGLIYDMNVESYVSHLCKEGYSTKNISLLAGEIVNCSEIMKLRASNKGIDGLNYPSMHIQVNTSKVSAVFRRRVTYVGKGQSVFYAKIYNNSPDDKGTTILATVTPNTLVFTRPYQKKSFKVTLRGKFVQKNPLTYHSASLVWTDGKHIVRSPILVYRSI